jgi:hypothetical protein
MMQKEGGAPFCILYTASVKRSEIRVKRNQSIFFDMEKRLTGNRIVYNIHKIYRQWFPLAGDSEGFERS